MSSSFATAQDREFIKEVSELSIEELMNLEVVTAEKRINTLQDTSSAVFIITEEDIKRSGSTTIVESLRGAPGIQVSRIDSNIWAVSARGFNERYSNKLLVMMDGRTLYTPIFSGVYWDVQDTVLEDIDRIEIVRGPGSTIWGANAVNGVINIITKDASKTQGWLISQVAGNEERLISTIRYGGKTGEDIYWRVYGKYTKRDNFVDMQGNDNNDNWYTGRTGFRIDYLPGTNKELTLQGDLYTGKVHSREDIPLTSPPYMMDNRIDEDVRGGNILGRYTQTFKNGSDLVIQFYYDRVERHQSFDIPGYHEDYRIDTADIDITHRFNAGPHSITYGGGVRFLSDHINNNTHITFNPERRDQFILNAFVQDEIALVRDRLYLTLGTKIEHNEYTGLEYEPTLRTLWHPSSDQTLWAAVSRAVRTPSRIEMDGRIDQMYDPNTNTMVSLISKDGYKSEELIAYEAGYRTNILKDLYIDIATFYFDYDNLRSFEEGTPFPEGSHFVLPYYGENQLYGESYGGEVYIKYRPFYKWTLGISYSYLQMQLHKRAGSTDPESETAEGESPHNQLTCSSYLELTPKLQMDTVVYYIDNLPAYGISSNIMTSLRLEYRPSKNIELSLAVQNAFDDKHPEIATKYVNSPTIQIERSIYGKVLIRL